MNHYDKQYCMPSAINSDFDSVTKFCLRILQIYGKKVDVICLSARFSA